MATSGSTDNINELLELLDSSVNLLRFNSLIEEEISKHGGKVVYSYNDIIIASEISDETYVELSKNPFIDIIYDVPLKRYGEIDYTLINQLDPSKIENNQSGASGENTTGSSGSSGKSGDEPLIISDLSITAATNAWFEYKIVTSGTQPIVLEFESSPGWAGPISLNGDILRGFCAKNGIFNMVIKASNTSGFDAKTLSIEISEKPIITSSLTATSKKSNQFSYEILSSGPSPKTYSVSGLTGTGLSLNGTFLTGTPTTSGVYYISMTVTSLSYGSDTKTLVFTVGSAPIITSASSISCVQGDDFLYTITSSGGFPTGITYSVVGTLPAGLTFSNDKISGTPTTVGVKTVTLNATNIFGTGTKQLSIQITNMHGSGS